MVETVRGGDISSKADAVHIKKDFPDKNISVEVAIKKGQKSNTCDIKLSLMKTRESEIVGVMESEKVKIGWIDIVKDGDTDKREKWSLKGCLLGVKK